MKKFSKEGQELWVLEVLKNKRNGFFVDIGAGDGIQGSNSYLLEKEFGWNGICVDANPNERIFPKLLLNRKCICVNKAVFSSCGKQKFVARGRRWETSGIYNEKSAPVLKKLVEQKHHKVIEVDSITLFELLKQHNAPSIIDYLSIDTEGTEYDILKNFDFSKYTFLTLTIEHNYRPSKIKKDSNDNLGYTSNQNKQNKDNIMELLLQYDYKFVKTVDVDDWFIHSSIG